ncbi:MAG: hypothetical protein E6R06_07235 [Mycobacterium sp.]|jgi:hypothetical protein|nr:MAG: hypothetical protein E6R06_07235 [Mycobacterium sp.]
MSTTKSNLQQTLDLIRATGWAPAGAPRRGTSIREAVRNVTGADHRRYTTAVRVIGQAAGQSLGLISAWETQPGRTQADVEQLLGRAIKLAH